MSVTYGWFSDAISSSSEATAVLMIDENWPDEPIADTSTSAKRTQLARVIDIEYTDKSS